MSSNQQQHTFAKLVLRDDVYCDAVEVTDENGFKVVSVPGTPILLQWDKLLGIQHWADDPRASMELTKEQQEANARRIVACVNALAHISTETLEGLNRSGIKLSATEGYTQTLETKVADTELALFA